jgi:CheY-like chemotaxis protein
MWRSGKGTEIAKADGADGADGAVTIFWPSPMQPPFEPLMKGLAVTIRGMRLLVVEDDLVLASLWADLFTDAGAQVIGPYASAEAALAMVQAGHLDAALLDIQVRDGDSFPVARTLQAIGVPFAFLSGSDRADVPAEFAGVPFLYKPVSAREVFAALAAFSPAD